MYSDTITPKQLTFLRALIEETGIGDEWLGAWCKPFGLTQRERGGRLTSLSKPAASKLIKGLSDIRDRQNADS